jgi:hypothetical protein
MLQLGVLTGINLDKKLLHQPVRQKCDICIRAKATDSAHTGSLPVPDEAWRRFSTDLSVKFNTMSIHGNHYQMAIIDFKMKYVWDYYLETKDQVFEKIQEWLEKEINLLRGRDPSGFEAVLFSDMGEAKSIRVEVLCSQYGMRRETTTGYSPAHNAFVERWLRTNAEMSRCQMLQYDTDDTYWEDSQCMATLIYNRVPPARKIPGEP